MRARMPLVITWVAGALLVTVSPALALQEEPVQEADATAAIVTPTAAPLESPSAPAVDEDTGQAISSPDPAVSSALPSPAGPTASSSASPSSGSRPGPGAESPPAQLVDAAPAVSGYVDAYLELSAEQQDLASDLLEAQNRQVRAQQLLAAAQAEEQELGMQVLRTFVQDEQSQSSLDDVVRQMYQGSGNNLAAVATVLVSGPQGFLDSLGAEQRARAAARSVVRTAQEAEVALEAARVRLSTIEQQRQGAQAADARAAADVQRTRSALAVIERRMSSLGAVAPQVAVGPEGCPTTNVPATLRDGSESLGAAALCRFAVKNAATPQAALAITWAFRHLGAAYACGGGGRMLPFRADCSSLVARAYGEGSGLSTSGDGWAPSTRNMVPWDGVALDPHYTYVAPGALRPGDLVLYDTCPQGGCPYKHVVMYLGSPDGRSTWMLHTNACGDVAKVETFWGFPRVGSRAFLVARRVMPLPGERVPVPAPRTP